MQIHTCGMDIILQFELQCDSCWGKKLGPWIWILYIYFKLPAPSFSYNASNTWIFMNDAKATLCHLWIHYEILKTALYVSLSSVRINDVPILATWPGGSVESVIEAGTEHWIAQAFYKPVCDRKTHKQQCGPTDWSECNNTHAFLILN